MNKKDLRITKTPKQNNEDIFVYGNPDDWQLLNKFSNGNTMKSTKAYEIKDVGVVMQATTVELSLNAISDSLVFIPNVRIVDKKIVKA